MVVDLAEVVERSAVQHEEDLFHNLEGKLCGRIEVPHQRECLSVKGGHETRGKDGNRPHLSNSPRSVLFDLFTQ